MSSTVVLAMPWRATQDSAPSTMRTRVEDRSSAPRWRTTAPGSRPSLMAPEIPGTARVTAAPPTADTVWRYLSHCQPCLARRRAAGRARWDLALCIALHNDAKEDLHRSIIGVYSRAEYTPNRPFL